MISVLMSVYNEKIEYIDKAIKSILNQSYDEIELIVVLDNPNSTEHLMFLEHQVKNDARIKLIVNEKNIGLAMSLNEGLKVARGEFIARMDADDISLPQRLEKELDFLQKEDIDIVSCYVETIDEHDLIKGEIKAPLISEKGMKRVLGYQNIIVHPTVLMRKEVLDSVGGYRNFATCQDYDLWLRLVDKGAKFGVLEEKLFKFRRHEGSITATKRYNQILNEKYIRLLHKERLNNNGVDSFSNDNLEKFLCVNGYWDIKKQEYHNQLMRKYRNGVGLVKKHLYMQGIKEIFVSLKSNVVRENLSSTVRANIIKKKYKKVL